MQDERAPEIRHIRISQKEPRKKKGQINGKER